MQLKSIFSDHLTIVFWPEHVTDFSAFLVGQIREPKIFCVRLVGHSHQHVSERVREEVRPHITFDIGVIPRLSCLSCGVDRSNLLVNFRICVHRVPETFSIGGVISSRKVLLVTIVEEGDSASCERKSDRRFKLSLFVGVNTQEASIVVIVQETAQKVHIFETGFFGCILVPNAVHGTSIAKDVAYSEEHGIVEQPLDVVLVVADKVRISVETFAHLENARRFCVFSPEVFGYLRDGVDANAIKVEFLNHILDPIFEIFPHIGVALVQIRQASQPAILNRVLVVPINVALGVIVLIFVQRVDLGKIVPSIIARMIGHNVEHYPDVLRVGSLNQTVQIFVGAKVFVHAFPI